MIQRLKSILNLIYISLPEYIAGFSVFIILIFLSHNLTLADIGEFTFANTLGQTVAAVFGVAILTILRRDFAFSNTIGDKYFMTIFFARIALFLCMTLIIVLTYSVKLINYLSFLMILARLIDSLSETHYYYLLSKNKFRGFSIVKSSHYVCLLFAILITAKIWGLNSIYYIGYIFVGNSLFWLLFNVSMVYSYKINKYIHWKSIYLKSFFNRMFPLLLSTFVFIISTRINILVIKEYCTPDEYGIFSIIISIIGIFSILATAMSSFLLNDQIVVFKKSYHSYVSIIKKQSLIFLVIGIFLYGISFLLSDHITLIFKNFDINYTGFLKLALISIIPTFLQVPINYYFTVINKNKMALIFSITLFIYALIVYISFSYLMQFKGAIFSLILYTWSWYIILVSLIFIYSKKINKI
ncbi:hypothetical protein EU348_05060 [Chryseobacterium indologenes]|uniref:Polysaccharide biosynthesis protein n=1 Tax=Chryseobacterium indologenes TaxID=253 RepID=A0A411DJQ2_CHRID|nr:hypothetical protein EU348_05060 [Chryseobacterium indologenes]